MIFTEIHKYPNENSSDTQFNMEDSPILCGSAVENMQVYTFVCNFLYNLLLTILTPVGSEYNGGENPG